MGNIQIVSLPSPDDPAAFNAGATFPTQQFLIDVKNGVHVQGTLVKMVRSGVHYIVGQHELLTLGGRPAMLGSTNWVNREQKNRDYRRRLR